MSQHEIEAEVGRRFEQQRLIKELEDGIRKLEHDRIAKEARDRSWEEARGVTQPVMQPAQRQAVSQSSGVDLEAVKPGASADVLEHARREVEAALRKFLTLPGC